jgi:hypothetical protein
VEEMREDAVAVMRLPCSLSGFPKRKFHQGRFAHSRLALDPEKLVALAVRASAPDILSLISVGRMSPLFGFVAVDPNAILFTLRQPLTTFRFGVANGMLAKVALVKVYCGDKACHAIQETRRSLACFPLVVLLPAQGTLAAKG